MKNFYLFAICIAVITSSCSEDALPKTEASANLSIKAVSFESKFEIQDDMYVFPDFKNLDLFLSEVNNINSAQLLKWEEENNIFSQKRMFLTVMLEEEKLEESLYALSSQEQERIRSQQEYNSDYYVEMQRKNLIKVYTSENDNTSFWDYTLVRPEVAPAVNLDGLVMVDNQLIKYSNNEFIYLIKDGDRSKLTEVTKVKETYEDDNYFVFKAQAYNPDPVAEDIVENRSHCDADNIDVKNYTKTNGWKYDGNRKRYKAWINGQSMSNFGQPCRYGTTCAFQIRTQAQKKNFWGNWRYQSGFSPSLNVINADWDYNYRLNTPAGVCVSQSQQTFTNSIPGGSYNPIFTNEWGSTNNGFFGLHPNTSGWWLFSQSSSTGQTNQYICETIDIFYNIPVVYNGAGPSNWNLIR